MKIYLIAAISDNSVIGNEVNELPWILPGDLANFRKLTTGNTVVMGWNTWRSIGEKPLPNRMNIVLSRTKRKLPRSRWVKQIFSPTDIFDLPSSKRPGKIFIIGGAQTYRAYLPIVDEMYLTFVHKTINGKNNIKFPTIDWRMFEKVSSSEWMVENDTHYDFNHYVKRD